MNWQEGLGHRFNELILFGVVVFMAIILLIPGFLERRDEAIRRQVTTKAEEEQPIVEREESAIEFLSNEILIKLKLQADKGVKAQLKVDDTGLPSIDKVNKEEKVAKFQKLYTPSIKSKIKDHPVYRWYKITLPEKREIIKESVSTIQDLESIISAKSQKLRSILAKYRQDPNIEEVSLNYVVHTTALPADTYLDPDQDGVWSTGAWGQPYEDLWGLKKIEADSAWNIATGSAQVVVAVVDTGVDYNHPDIVSNLWTNPEEIPGNGLDDDNNGFIDDVRGWDFVTFDDGIDDNDPIDDHGHGTHVSGTIAAMGNNNLGIIGVAPKAKIMALKGLSEGGAGTMDDLANAIRYAADNGAQVISNSWGCSFCPSNIVIEDAVRYAHSPDDDNNSGLVIVFAAGNSNDDVIVRSPQNMPETIVVSAFDHNDQKASFSSYGTLVDVAAPGGDSTPATPSATYEYNNILSLRAAGTDMYCSSGRPERCEAMVVDNDYYRARGTSMATPHVSGLAALIIAKHPEFTNEEVRQTIRVSADDVDAPGFDINSGSGRINAARALTVDSVLQVLINTPGQRTNLADLESVDIVGTATGPNFVSYQLSYGQGLTPTDWMPIGNSSFTPVVNGLLGTWKIESLDSGRYTIRLTATDTAGFNYDAYVGAFVETDLVSGWPIEFSAPDPASLVVISDAAVGDVDGDGQDDLVVTIGGGTFGSVVNGSLYVIRKDGSFLPGWPVELGSVSGVSLIEPYSPYVVDLDEDGEKEIVGMLRKSVNGVPSWEIFALSTQGQMLPGWPKQIEGFPRIRLAVGDINGDGNQEIVFPETLDFSGNNSFIRALSKDGSLVGSVPITGLRTLNPFPLPILIDIDDDGAQEVLSYARGVVEDSTLIEINNLTLLRFGVGTIHEWNIRPKSILAVSSGTSGNEKIMAVLEGVTTGILHLWDLPTGAELPNWPQSIPDWPHSFDIFRENAGGMVSFADVTGDGQDEIILNLFFTTGNSERVLIYSLDGSLISEWSEDIIPGYSRPIFGDVTQDGLPEMLLRYPEALMIFDHIGEKLWERRNLGFYNYAVPKYPLDQQSHHQ